MEEQNLHNPIKRAESLLQNHFRARQGWLVWWVSLLDVELWSLWLSFFLFQLNSPT
jgi:hypothetical protein